MSSKGGPRAAGTDGNDFQHREQVASQYKISAQLKSRIWVCLMLNVSTAMVQLGALAAAHFELVEGASEFAPDVWQYTWMASGGVSLIGLSALAKNKSAFLNLHNLGMVMFGFGGVAFGLLAQYTAYHRHQFRGETRRIAEVPVYYIWTGILVLSLMNFVATYFYSIRLQTAWSVRKSR